MATARDKRDELAAALKEARASSPREPHKRHGAIREAVAANLDDLLAMREKGFSDAEIADIFRSKGFAATAGTLKTYINALRAQKSGLKRPARKAKTPRATQAATAGKRVSNPPQSAPAVTARMAAKPSELATRPAAAGGSTTASKALGHRLDDDV